MIHEDDLNPPFPFWVFVTMAVGLVLVWLAAYMKGQ
jgi:hypothetical protein